MASYLLDCETNGLLRTLTKIHLLVLRNPETKEKFVYRHNDEENTIEEGLRRLEEADEVIGHNIILFDLKAIKKVYPKFRLKPGCKIIDTLVVARILRPDIKETDFPLQKAGKIPGKYIGSHALAAWGYRLGLNKGDYAEDMVRKGLDPWEKWNPEMEDYCVLDTDVNLLMWDGMKKHLPSDLVFDLETQAHDITGVMENNGFPFDIEAAEALAEKLRSKYSEIYERTKARYQYWFAPEKKHIVKPPWTDDISEFMRKKIKKPRTEWGEDYSRAIWGDFVIPKKTTKSTSPLRPSRTEGAAYCKIKRVDFNPGSRHNIIDRFTIVHGWEPTEFTESGQPEVDDVVLTALKEKIPEAADIAELLFHKKLLGQLANGPSAWIKKYDSETKSIHPSTNTGGTVTRRCAHYGPNIGQVPAVETETVIVNGEKTKVPILGRRGNYGYECRSLFTVRQGFLQVGVDLSGIEFRCLAEECATFDDGEMIDVVLNGDIHAYNMEKTGIDDRDVVKRLLYACVPMDTQALTLEGWKTYDQLRVGELIMTYNAELGIKEWQPLLEKVYYEDAPLIEMSTDHSFKVVSTPNHRWFTRRRVSGRKRGRYYVDEVCTTEELTTEHAIIQNAPFGGVEYVNGCSSDYAFLPKYETNWVRTVLSMSAKERAAFLSGFCIADGHWKKSKDGRKPGRWCWTQNIGNLSEAALLASYLVWETKIYTTARTATLTPMIVVKQGVNNNVTGQRLKKRKLPNAPVWCVRTTNQSWVMRQGNTITITGNTLYGAGDLKLGITASPYETPVKQLKIGREMRSILMKGLPALNKAINRLKNEAEKGWIQALDGGRLKVRSPHSVLNLKLQSSGAILAKKWMCLTEDYALEEGWDHGWEGDFAMMAFVHDELQNAAKPYIAEDFATICKIAAVDAGKFYNYLCPIAAEAKIGKNWAECH